MTQPIWLLDFDGVINALELPGPWPREKLISTSEYLLSSRMAIDAAGPVLDFIREVHASGRADIRWHSTWQDEIEYVAKNLNLPDLPVEPAPEYSYFAAYHQGGQDGAWWKLPAVERLLDAGYRVLWTDDDLNRRLSIPMRLRLRALHCYMICPMPSGLGPEELKKIDSYLPAP